MYLGSKVIESTQAKLETRRRYNDTSPTLTMLCFKSHDKSSDQSEPTDLIVM